MTGQNAQPAGSHLPSPSAGRLEALRDPTSPDPEPSIPVLPPSGGPLEAIFPPIADYAFLSDCENTCLISPTGAVEWLCIPRPHDPSVFGTILDRAAGSFRLGPADTAVPANRRYVPGTMVLATTWQTRTGWLAVRDFLVIAPWHHTRDRSPLHRRTPGDFDATHMLVRSATCLHGSVEFVLDCEPVFDYGRVDARWEYADAAYGRVITTNPDFPTLTLAGDLRLGIQGRGIRARHRLTQGESCFAALSWGDLAPPATAAEVSEALTETNRFWRGWIDGGRFPDHPWREQLQRSALTLKAMTYAPTGALLAAPTTSLPEDPGGHRNWDYRYTWVRDSAFALWALHALGLDAEADDFLAFLADVREPEDAPASSLSTDRALQATDRALQATDRALQATDRALQATDRALQVLYAVDGTSILPETEIDHLSGYAGSRPVRIGNAAYLQDQFDLLGAIVDCVYQHTRTRDALGERAWRMVVDAVETALESWRRPDQSIWETRGQPRQFTFSKVMCWVAADRGARLAALRGESDRADRWWTAALEIHQDVCDHGVDSKGRFTQYYGSENLDASLLILPLVRFLPPDDPRLRATVLGITTELGEDGFVRRYRTDTTDDGLDEPEGTFTVCSFWLVSALVEIGELETARMLCERLLGAASALGLYGEELDPATGRHLGNFPQALTHLSLVNAVLHVIEAERRANDAALVNPSSTGRPAASPSWWTAATRNDRPDQKAG